MNGVQHQKDINWRPYERFDKGKQRIFFSSFVMFDIEVVNYHRPQLSPLQLGIKNADTSKLENIKFKEKSRRGQIEWKLLLKYREPIKFWKDKRHTSVVKGEEGFVLPPVPDLQQWDSDDDDAEVDSHETQGGSGNDHFNDGEYLYESTNEGPSKRGRGRPRKVPISAVKVEPTVILLDDEDAVGQNNVHDGPPVSPVAKKARRVKAEIVSQASAYQNKHIQNCDEAAIHIAETGSGESNKRQKRDCLGQGVPHASAYLSKEKVPSRPTCKEIYDVISNVDGITDDDVMRAVERFRNGDVDEFDMLKSLPDNQKKRSWILVLIND
ncbi:uncharacterized protein LOC141682504 [Apium graveolens]|uniref:uncharacterized protein LOC141682504 n=1 Tax=Apium graveolens TaxID=4045 RepID=UPI003D79AB73